MKKKIFIISLIMTMLLSFTSFAGLKTIPNVIISCTNKVEVNTIVSEINVDYNGSNTGDLNINVSGTDYYIEDCSISGGDGKYVSVGNTLKVKVVLVPKNTETHAFSGTYSSSNVKISGGTFVSCNATKGALTVTFNTTPVSGQLPAPENPTWKSGSSSSSTSQPVASPDGPAFDSNYTSKAVVAPNGPGSVNVDEETTKKTTTTTKESTNNTKKTTTKVSGTASWTNPTGGTGYYEIWLYLGSSCIKKVEDYKGTSYDFYSCLTKPGTYYYKIRTVPHTNDQKKYTQRSEFVVSDELYIDAEHVSDGKEKENGPTDTKTIGWVKSGTTWYYRYPDGNLKKNGWEKVNDRWYLFDKDGKMLTGLQTVSSGTYYLAASGDMLTGWRQVDKKWYFFEDKVDSPNEGAMYKNQWINEEDKTYYLGTDGVMCTGWKQIGDIWYHFDVSGNLSRDTMVDTFYVDKDGKWIK